jgi:hypothetical protein
MAFGFPLVAGWLLGISGAFVPMLLYYGAAWGLVIWRRGSTGYSLKGLERPPVSFYVHLGVIALILVFAYASRIRVPEPNVAGVVLTGTVWAVANASSEQLLWLYIFDSWDLFGADRFGRGGRILFRILGIALFSAYVGLIHTMYWARFLHTVDPGTLFGIFFVIGTSVSGYLHIIVWRQSGRMVYTFIPHFILNLAPLIWTGYSIVPYLFTAR